MTSLTRDDADAPGGRWTLEEHARVLTASGDYRVLRRFRPRMRYERLAAGAEPRRGVVLDVETTGTAAADRIIEIACLPFSFDRVSGAVIDVDPVVAFLEDPGFAIPDAVVELTGITDGMVTGQSIDDAAIEAVLMAADIVIAHSARFDCGFVERRFPTLARRHWACSLNEVPWKRHGNPSNALEALIITHAGEFPPSGDDERAHRAGTDCAMTLHCLATPHADGSRPLAQLLESARRVSYQVWAIDTPRGTNDALKSRGYRFNYGDDGRPKGWCREVLPAERNAEREWLEAAIYAGKRSNIVLHKVTATGRWSSRWDDRRVRAEDAVLPTARRDGVRERE